MMYNYYIDGRKLRDIGAYVIQSIGWQGLPKPKPATTESWQNQHGTHLYGTAHLCHEPRNIKLNLTIIPTEGYTLEANINRLTELLKPQGEQSPSLLRLSIRPIVEQAEGQPSFEAWVYRSEALEPKKHAHGAYATAELSLIEPNPNSQ